MPSVTHFESLEHRTLLSANLVADMGGTRVHQSLTMPNGDTYFAAMGKNYSNYLWLQDAAGHLAR